VFINGFKKVKMGAGRAGLSSVEIFAARNKVSASSTKIIYLVSYLGIN